MKEATWDKIEERRTMKQKMNSTRSERIKNQLRTQYSTLNKDVKKMAKADKKAYVEGLAEEAEQAAGRQDLKTLYSITKTLNGKYTHSNVPVRDKEGKVLSKESEQVPRWKEHFESLLNRPDPITVPGGKFMTRFLSLKRRLKRFKVLKHVFYSNLSFTSNLIQSLKLT